MDPLNLLREWTKDGKLDSIRLGPDRVEFADSYSFRRGAPTSYKSQKGKGDFYGLATLLVFLRNRKTPFPQYVKITKEENVPTVSYLDRKDVEAYLTGQSSSSDFIQLVAPDLNFASIPDQQAPAAAADGVEPAAKRARLDAHAAAAPVTDAAGGPPDSLMQQVARYERRLWDRNSALVVPGKTFAKAAQLARDALYEPQRRPEPPRSASHRGRQPAIPIKPSGRLERSAGPDTTLQEMGFKDVKIQTYGAAAGSAAAPPPPPPPPIGVNGSAGPGASVRHPRSSGGGAPAAPPSTSKRRPSSMQQSSSASQHRSSSGHKTDPRKGLSPIIIVPKGYETKINMFNAKAFLEEGRYLTYEEAQQMGVQKASQVSFKRTIGRDKPVTYHITDVNFGPRDPAWRRVVAVFVQGKAWQFKEWPFKGAAAGDMVDAFNRMLAVHLVAANEQPPPLVKSWNVKIMKLHPNDRHGDMQLARDFYTYLDAMLGAKASTLAY